VTPAQLEVERDRLLEGGRTLEEVARMQWVVTSGAEDDVWERLRRATDAYRRAYGRVARDDGDIDAARRGLRAMERRLLSPPETAAGASAPRPQGETP